MHPSQSTIITYTISTCAHLKKTIRLLRVGDDRFGLVKIVGCNYGNFNENAEYLALWTSWFVTNLKINTVNFTVIVALSQNQSSQSSVIGRHTENRAGHINNIFEKISLL
jgi:hypothetical protein